MRAYSRSLRRRHFGLEPSPAVVAARAAEGAPSPPKRRGSKQSPITRVQKRQLMRQMHMCAMLSRRGRKLLEARAPGTSDPMPRTPTVEEVEGEFWRIVDDGACPCGCPLLGSCRHGLRPFGNLDDGTTAIAPVGRLPPPALYPWETPESAIEAHGAYNEMFGVLYPSDLPASRFGSGFPLIGGTPAMRAASARRLAGPTTAADEQTSGPYRTGKFAGWNLNALPLHEQSLLRYLNPPRPNPLAQAFPALDDGGEGDVPGLTSPFVYLGSVFSAFCWHTEDHDLHSINYHHCGAPKAWYGVPAHAAHAFERAVRDVLAPQLVRQRPGLLHDIVTHIPPARLARLGIPVCRLVQRPGEFVVTLPRAYHSGVNLGSNMNEAVNLGAASWIKAGTASAEQYRNVRSPALCMERLCLHVLRARESDAAAGEAAPDAAAFLRRRIAEERRYRALLTVSLHQPLELHTVVAEPVHGNAPIVLPSVHARDVGASYGTRRALLPKAKFANPKRLEAGGWPKGTLAAARAILQRRGSLLTGALLECSTCRVSCHLGVVVFPFANLDALENGAAAHVLARRADDAGVEDHAGGEDLLQVHCVACAHQRRSEMDGPPLLLARFTNDELAAIDGCAASAVDAATARATMAAAAGR